MMSVVFFPNPLGILSLLWFLASFPFYTFFRDAMSILLFFGSDLLDPMCILHHPPKQIKNGKTLRNQIAETFRSLRRMEQQWGFASRNWGSGANIETKYLSPPRSRFPSDFWAESNRGYESD